MIFCRKYCRFIVIAILLLLFSFCSKAQTDPKESKWGPNDTLIVPAIIYEGESLPYKEMEMVWVSNLPPDKLAKFIEEWSRLRNAVYVTYPYARIAGATINDMNVQLANVNSKNLSHLPWTISCFILKNCQRRPLTGKGIGTAGLGMECR